MKGNLLLVLALAGLFTTTAMPLQKIERQRLVAHLELSGELAAR